MNGDLPVQVKVASCTVKFNICAIIGGIIAVVQFWSSAFLRVESYLIAI